MKRLKVYNGELVKRGPIWYVIFGSFMVFLVFWSVFHGSLMWAISVAFIFLVIIVGYVLSYLMSLKKTEVVVEDWYLIIWNKTYSFDQLYWFNVELDEKSNPINFVISLKNSNLPLKFTINDSFENVKEIISELIEKWLPLYDWYENDKFYKIIKMLRL